MPSYGRLVARPAMLRPGEGGRGRAARRRRTKSAGGLQTSRGRGRRLLIVGGRRSELPHASESGRQVRLRLFSGDAALPPIWPVGNGILPSRGTYLVASTDPPRLGSQWETGLEPSHASHASPASRLGGASIDDDMAVGPFSSLPVRDRTTAGRWSRRLTYPRAVGARPTPCPFGALGGAFSMRHAPLYIPRYLLARLAVPLCPSSLGFGPGMARARVHTLGA